MKKLSKEQLKEIFKRTVLSEHSRYEVYFVNPNGHEEVLFQRKKPVFYTSFDDFVEDAKRHGVDLPTNAKEIFNGKIYARKLDNSNLWIREQMEIEPLPMDDDIIRTRQWVNEMNRLTTEITDWLKENSRLVWVEPSKSGLRESEPLDKILRAAVVGCSQLLSREKARAKTKATRLK